MIQVNMHILEINNKIYSKISGIPIKDLVILEIEFLKSINFELYISYSKYDSYYKKIINIS